MNKLCALIAPLLASVIACTQNDDPEGAKQLYAKINEGPGFTSWRRAPGWPERRPSFTAHSREVEIFVNPTLEAALAGPDPVTAWPEGSIIDKRGFSGDKLAITAVMEKRAGEWYWAEYDAEGDPFFSGKPKICLDCHDNRASYSDWVYAFELPR